MKVIKKYLETREGTYSFYFEEINSGYLYGLNENKEMVSAGCIKLPLAMVLLKEVEDGKIDLQSKIKIEAEDKTHGSNGIIHELSGKEYSLYDLLIAMLIQSDNTAANKIIEILSMQRIDELFVGMGLKNTKLKRITTDAKLEQDELENITSSFDLSKCFKLLYLKQYLNEENSNLLLRILKKQQVTNKLPFYVPKQIQQNIANKGGSLDTVENDTSIIMIEKGNFLFTVMANNLPNNVYGITTISRVGKMMWDIIDKDWK
ncbi:class A beta-lactamase-related serine hydrolase [Clostridium estertheticum]|uniref:serine hydrolase n=1 Tax=Clostridium estertheticum TaxID=238834 RepID=UPI0013E92FB0|nr:serine hydrolase [Clostridium estertheticum]MBZ9688869.1 class A beta-lactamase-related serine hydrolase [Clostridium estertheticum]